MKNKKVIREGAVIMRNFEKFMAVAMATAVTFTSLPNANYVAFAEQTEDVVVASEIDDVKDMTETQDEAIKVTPVTEAAVVATQAAVSSQAAVEDKTFKIDAVKIKTSKAATRTIVDLKNGKAPYTYEYTFEKISGKEQTEDYVVNKSKYASATQHFPTHLSGDYRLSVKVTDAEENVATKTQKFTVNPFTISEIATNYTAPVVTGTALSFKAICENNWVNKESQSTTWSIVKDGQIYMDKTVLAGSTDFEWTPSEIGNYEVKVDAVDAAGEKASKSIPVVVKESSENVAVVYYESGWENARIHYKVGNGDWNSIPGDKMTKTSYKQYNWMYAIDLDDAENATICFTDGRGDWDNNQNRNYVVEVGTTGIQNGEVSKFDFQVADTVIDASKEGTILTAKVAYGVAPYKYEVSVSYEKDEEIYNDKTVINSNSKEVDAFFLTHYSGNYQATVKVTDADGNETEESYDFEIKKMQINGVVANSVKVASDAAIKFTAKTANSWSYYLPMSTYWTIEKDGEVVVDAQCAAYEKSFTWVPEEAGTYNVKVYAKDSSGDEISYKFEYVVK